MDLPEEKLGYLNESLIVYLADKQIQGERRVTIEERFAAKREKFKDNPEAAGGCGTAVSAGKACGGITVKRKRGKSYEINENNRGSRTGTLP